MAQAANIFQQYAQHLIDASKFLALAVKHPQGSPESEENFTLHHFNLDAADKLRHATLAPLNAECDRWQDAAYYGAPRTGAVTKYKAARSKLWSAEHKFKAAVAKARNPKARIPARNRSEDNIDFE